MAKLQRRFKVGSEYTIQGAAKLKRRVWFVARVTIYGHEVLIFRTLRKARKTK